MNMTFFEFLKSKAYRRLSAEWLVRFLSFQESPMAKVIAQEIIDEDIPIIEMGGGTGPWSDSSYDFELTHTEIPEDKDRFGMYDYSQQYRDQGFYIPMRMMDGIKRWVDEGIVPGQRPCKSGKVSFTCMRKSVLCDMQRGQEGHTT